MESAEGHREAGGPSTFDQYSGSVAGTDRVHTPTDGQRKRGRSLADKENKRLKRLFGKIVSGRQESIVEWSVSERLSVATWFQLEITIESKESLLLNKEHKIN